MKKSFFFLALVVLSATMIQAKDLKLILTGGSEVGFTDVQKLTFTDGKVTATTSDGSTMWRSIAEIEKIVFGTTGIHAVSADDAGISISPVQATDVISVNGVKETCRVIIYGAGGNVVASAMVSDGQTIDVSALAAGTYVMLIGENVVAKFVKL
ncbi:MAG: T9SS type A sorting domain-containing protein [Muribaculaceae bacterium]